MAVRRLDTFRLFDKGFVGTWAGEVFLYAVVEGQMYRKDRYIDVTDAAAAMKTIGNMALEIAGEIREDNG